MDFIDKVSKTVSDAGQKTHDVMDIVSLNNKVSDNERQISKFYTKLGELYYNAHSEDAEQNFQELVNNISDLKSQNTDWNDKLQELKGYIKCPDCGEYVKKDVIECPNCGKSLLPEGAVVCPNCGEITYDQDMAFCQYCGSKLPRKQENQASVIHNPGLILCKCGAVLEEDDLFCPLCGTSRKELEQPQNS